MISFASARLRKRVLASVAIALVLTNAVASESTLPDSLQLSDVTTIAVHNRAEVAAAKARAEALAQRPAIVGALEDPMVSPSIDHYPFEMPGEDGEMGDTGAGGRYDWSITVEQRFPLSGVRGHRRSAARADAQRAQACCRGRRA